MSQTFPWWSGCKRFRSNWPLRTNLTHRQSVKTIQDAQTITERNRRQTDLGCRYSILLELDYFDPVRMLVIDPMHNLFLGSAKHSTKSVWRAKNVLDISDRKLCERVQNTMNNIHAPIDIGRIPIKIETGFSGFTADQFKNWVNLYSIVCLYGVIADDDLECWRHFSLQFCRRVQRMYGSDVITPNMHMHCHLKSVLLDYGPVFAFWLFSYERYNGILEHQPTSNRCIETQLMRRFLQDNSNHLVNIKQNLEVCAIFGKKLLARC